MQRRVPEDTTKEYQAALVSPAAVAVLFVVEVADDNSMWSVVVVGDIEHDDVVE